MILEDNSAPNPALDVAIISIDDYTDLPDIPNARQNGRDWYRYFNTSREIRRIEYFGLMIRLPVEQRCSLQRILYEI